MNRKTDSAQAHGTADAGRPGDFPPQPRLARGSIALRPSTPDDCAFVLEAERHPDNVRFVEQWTMDRHLRCMERPDCLHWIVEHGGHPIGYAILQDADDPGRSLLLRRIVIASKGRGHGRAAVILLARYCFDVLRFHRLWLYVAVNNRRARILYRKLGFVEEGIARECARDGDRYVSMAMMSMLEAEYRQAFA